MYTCHSSFCSNMYVLESTISPDNGLILLCGRSARNSNSNPQMNTPCVMKIFTLEGYHVTTLANISYAKRTKFTSDMMVFCDKSITRVNEFNTRSKPIKTVNFLECDDEGNIYTNGEEDNSISVLSHDLEIKRRLSLGVTKNKIIDVLIKDDTINMIVSSGMFRYKIRRHHLGTFERIKSPHLNAQLFDGLILQCDLNNQLFVTDKHGWVTYFQGGRTIMYNLERNHYPSNKCILLVKYSLLVLLGDTVKIFNYRI